MSRYRYTKKQKKDKKDLGMEMKEAKLRKAIKKNIKSKFNK